MRGEVKEFKLFASARFLAQQALNDFPFKRAMQIVFTFAVFLALLCFAIGTLQAMYGDGSAVGRAVENLFYRM